MKIIGITGGVGCGKSTVVNIITEYTGAQVIITDDVAKNLMKKGQISYSLILNEFGKDILDNNDNIDRKKLAEVVFSSEKKLLLLNSFTHPYVRKSIVNDINKARQLGKKYVIIESALFKEAGFEQLCDTIWFITADKNIRKQRLISNRGYSESKTEAIISNQYKDDEYIAVCDEVIYNNGNKEELKKRIIEALGMEE